MFGFGDGGAKPLTRSLIDALERGGVHSGPERDSLRFVETSRKYSGRKVSEVRVFNEKLLTAAGITVKSWGDLDTHLDQVIATGHIEKDGTAMLNQFARAQETTATAFTREAADRSSRSADESVVFHSSGRQDI